MKFLRLLAILSTIPIGQSVFAQEPTLEVVLGRAGTYVVEFQRSLSGVVAEEQYVQSVRYPLGTGSRVNQLLPTHRELKSDLLLVKPAGVDRWLQFRDVFQVDGKEVRDRNERLMQLFVTPSSSSAAQAERILTESARYNIGNLQRTVNSPVLALVILDPANQSRFTFRRTTHDDPLLGRVTAKPLGSVWIAGDREGHADSDDERQRPAGARAFLDRARHRPGHGERDDRRGPAHQGHHRRRVSD